MPSERSKGIMGAWAVPNGTEDVENNISPKSDEGSNMVLGPGTETPDVNTCLAKSNDSYVGT